MKFLRYILNEVRTQARADEFLDRVGRNKRYRSEHDPDALHTMTAKFEKMPQLPAGHEWYFHGKETVSLKSIKTNQQYIGPKSRISKIVAKLLKNPEDHRALGYMHPNGTTYLHDGNHTMGAHRAADIKNVHLDVYKARRIE